MSEHDYEDSVVALEDAYHEQYKDMMVIVDSKIDDAYDHLQKACSIYLRDDVLSDAMTYGEFKQYLIGKIKDML